MRGIFDRMNRIYGMGRSWLYARWPWIQCRLVGHACEDWKRFGPNSGTFHCPVCNGYFAHYHGEGELKGLIIRIKPEERESMTRAMGFIGADAPSKGVITP
jgi:hypothetical protein